MQLRHKSPKRRVLAVVDTFSPYVLDARCSYRSEDVVTTLDRVHRAAGYPKMIRVDQGSEFVSRDMDLWACQRRVALDFPRLGKLTLRASVHHWFKDDGKGLHRSLQQPRPRRVP